MFQAELIKAGLFRYKEIDLPKLTPNEVLVKIEYNGICGGDMRFYSGRSKINKPIVRGHEFGGVIKAIGGKNSLFEIGTKVVINPMIYCNKCYYCKNNAEQLCENLIVIGSDINGGMQEEAIIPINNVIPLDKKFDLIHAPFIEPLAVALHAVGELKNSNVLIIGLGNIGLLIQQICKYNGNNIIAIDTNDYSLKISTKLFADFIVNINDKNKENKIKKFLGYERIDVIFDNVSSEETLLFDVKIIKKNGKIIIVGIPSKNFKLDVINIIFKEIKLFSSFIFKNIDFTNATNYILNKKINVEPLISKVFALKNIKKAFDYKLKNSAIKVLLKNK